MRTAMAKFAETSPTREAGTKSAPSPTPLAQLQRAAGNRAILRAMSGGVPAAKLKIGTAGDAFEHEADRVADEVMKTPSGRVQRACACGGSCDDCSRTHDESEPVRRKSVSSSNAANGDSVAGVVRGRGAPLDPATRAFMEPRFGSDFAHVRVHTGSDAEQSAASLNAHAYTVGRDIVFGAGEYRPHTAEGRHLLAHELTHVAQQSDDVIRRKMKLTSPMALAPWRQDFAGPPPPTRAIALQRWLDELCGRGRFVVNPLTGSVAAAARESVCRKPQKKGCECLCEATSNASKDIEIQIDEKLRFYGKPDEEGTAMEHEFDLAERGGALTYPQETWAAVGMPGGIAADLEGVGDTSPKQAGTDWRSQVLRTPDWLIFGHELCGHALLQSEPSQETSHLMTPEGDRSAIDVENQLRREHSTATDSLGIRHGVFLAELVQGWNPVWMQGAAFRVGMHDTLTGIAERAGIPASSMLDHIYRFNGVYGTRITDETQNTIAPGDELLIEGISWHTVIKGETVNSVSEMWNIPPSELRRANQLPETQSVLRPGTRLLIPAN